MFGASSESEKLLHLPTVKQLGADLLSMYNEELRSEVDCTGEVVTYKDMFERAREIVATTETFDIILEHLSDIGELTVGTTKHGEKVLKFKDHGSQDPVKFTEADASVVDIRKAMNKLDREIQQLEEKVKKYDAQCRASLRSGEKGRAQNFLRQRKRAEKDVADKDMQYQKLLTMLHQISAAKNNKDVLKAYQSGTAAFKATLARQGLSPDKIHETMDDVANSIDEYREIEEAISSPFVNANGHNDADLERELDELLSESKVRSILVFSSILFISERRFSTPPGSSKQSIWIVRQRSDPGKRTRSSGAASGSSETSYVIFCRFFFLISFANKTFFQNKFITRSTNLLRLLSAKTSVSVCQLDVQLSSALDDSFAALGGDSVSDLSDVLVGLHEEHVQILEIIDYFFNNCF